MNMEEEEEERGLFASVALVAVCYVALQLCSTVTTPALGDSCVATVNFSARGAHCEFFSLLSQLTAVVADLNCEYTGLVLPPFKNHLLQIYKNGNIISTVCLKEVCRTR